MHAQRALASPRFEDFVYVQELDTARNVFAWLGNGLTTAQENDEKTTGYLDTVDIPPILNKGPNPKANKTKTQLKEVHVNGNGLLDRASDEQVKELIQAQMTIPS